MPTDATGLSLIRDVKDLQRLMRLHRSRNVSGAPFWDYQEFTTAGPNTLRYLPINLSPHVELNGNGLREGTDYTWNYATGVITLTATFTAGDILMIRYQTTGQLQVGATPADTGLPVAYSGASKVSGYSGLDLGAMPTAPGVGDLLIAMCTSRTSGTWTTPSGYTQYRQDNVADLYTTVFTKVATSADATDIGTFTNSGAGNYTAVIVIALQNATGITAAGVTSEWITYPQLAGVAGGMYVGFTGWGYDDSSSPSINPPMTGFGVANNGTHAWVSGGMVTISAAGTVPATAGDYSISLGTSATHILSVGLIVR